MGWHSKGIIAPIHPLSSDVELPVAPPTPHQRPEQDDIALYMPKGAARLHSCDLMTTHGRLRMSSTHSRAHADVSTDWQPAPPTPEP